MRLARGIFKVVFALAVLYVAAVAGLFVVMKMPPPTFGRIMSRMPDQAFAILPFRSLWMTARKGGLDTGDPAPDFRLKTVDGKSQVALSTFRGRKPVVLVFGSYT